MAMVAATIANDGVMMKPQAVLEIRDRSGRRVALREPERLGQVVRPETARTVGRIMSRVVEEGTGSGVRGIEGLAVAGKTGTAETGRGDLNDAWFIAFAPVDQPDVAVAVVVEDTTETGRRRGGPDRASHPGGALVRASCGRRAGPSHGAVGTCPDGRTGTRPCALTRRRPCAGCSTGRYRSSARSGAVAWPASSWPRTSRCTARSRSRCWPSATPRTSSSSSASSARPRRGGGLNHPNIVQIYDRGQAEGTYYIAMEYLEGENLKELINREGRCRRGARST
jgi:membrane peptidoglycan carboxypeptidase